MGRNFSICLLIASSVCLAGANLENVGELGKGEEGFYKRCFTRMSLSNLMEAYYRQPVRNLLSADGDKLDTKLDGEFTKFGGSSACSRSCYDSLVPYEYQFFIPGEKQLDASRCERYARFNRLCELVESHRGADEDARLVAIEEWLCQTRESLSKPLYRDYFKCKDDENFPAVYEKKAEESLELILSYDLEQLEEVKKVTAKQIEVSDKRRKEFDEKINQEAYSKVNNGINLISRYIECSKKEKGSEMESKPENEEAHRAAGWVNRLLSRKTVPAN